jgi:hypothetical protein
MYSAEEAKSALWITTKNINKLSFAIAHAPHKIDPKYLPDEFTIEITETDIDENGEPVYACSHNTEEIYNAVRKGRTIKIISPWDEYEIYTCVRYNGGSITLVNNNFVNREIIIYYSGEVKVSVTCSPSIQTASVGQVIVVKTINDDGKPTEWETVDMPSGGSAPVEYNVIILKSSTEGSSKKFRLTIDDDGILSAEEAID